MAGAVDTDRPGYRRAVPAPVARRAGWLVTGASALVAVATLLVVTTLDPGPARSVALAVAVAAAFLLAAWRAVRARRDTSAVHGARPIASWIAVFSWAVTVFASLVALAAPTSGVRAALAGVLAGSVLVLVGRGAERVSARDRPDAR